jgi:hypothetical protein
MATKRVIPPLVRLTPSEAAAIESMFRLYDYKSSGRIPQHLAYKLATALGFDVSVHSLPQNGSLKDILLFLDMRIVDPEPALYAQLHSFTHMVAKRVDLNKKKSADEDDGEGDGDGIENERGDTFDSNVNVNGGGANKPAPGRQRKPSDGSVNSKATDSGTPSKSTVAEQSQSKLMTAAAINDFVVSLGRPPMNSAQLELMLTAMLEYDDCNEKTAGAAGVLPEDFSREFATFAKKSNALKNFK